MRVLQNDQDPTTQAQALNACATLYSSAGRYQELSSLLNDYLKRHAKGEEFGTSDDYTLYMGFSQGVEKLPAEQVVDFLALQMREGSHVDLLWAYASLLSPRDFREVGMFTKVKVYSPQVHVELKKRAEELLVLCAERPNPGNAEKCILVLFIKDCEVFEAASSKTNEAIKQLLVRLPASTICDFLDLLPNDVVEQGQFDSIKKELFSKETSPVERDGILRGLFKLSESKLREKHIFVQKLVAEVIANQLGPEPIKFDRYRRMKVYANSLDVEQATEFKERRMFGDKGFHRVEISSPAVVARQLLDEISRQLKGAVKDTDQELYEKNGLASAKTLHEILSKRSSVALEKLEGVTLKHYQFLQIEHDIDAIGKMGRGEGGKLSDFVLGRTFGPKQK